jgi:hypothetical protein
MNSFNSSFISFILTVGVLVDPQLVHFYGHVDEVVLSVVGLYYINSDINIFSSCSKKLFYFFQTF